MRYKLCTLENSKGKTKTAYLKETQAKLNATFITRSETWTIMDISTLSITEENLDKLKTNKELIKE